MNGSIDTTTSPEAVGSIPIENVSPSETPATETKTTPSAESDTCRYSSKPCANPRALKKTGALHSFCEFHRLMANRNQRRCEHKRRVKLQFENAAKRRSVQTLMGPDIVPVPTRSKLKNKYKRRQTAAKSSPTSVDSAAVFAIAQSMDSCKDKGLPKAVVPIPVVEIHSETEKALEPYAHPVALHDEDLQYLFMTVVDSMYINAAGTASPSSSTDASTDVVDVVYTFAV